MFPYTGSFRNIVRIAYLGTGGFRLHCCGGCQNCKQLGLCLKWVLGFLKTFKRRVESNGLTGFARKCVFLLGLGFGVTRPFLSVGFHDRYNLSNTLSLPLSVNSPLSVISTARNAFAYRSPEFKVCPKCIAAIRDRH